MTLPTEAVTLAGSGLVFINSYDDSVTSAYRGAGQRRPRTSCRASSPTR